MDTDEEAEDQEPELKRRRVLTEAERLTRTSKGRMQRVIERIKMKKFRDLQRGRRCPPTGQAGQTGPHGASQ